jgi:hypothetical protein
MPQHPIGLKVHYRKGVLKSEASLSIVCAVCKNCAEISYFDFDLKNKTMVL